MTEPRDWDRELAEIDKVIARQSGPAGPAGVSVAKGPSPSAPAARSFGGAMGALGTWLRVLLGLALAVGITQWPYPSACGLNLAVYLLAIAAIIVSGVWSAVSSWRRRLGLAHILSLLVVLWGLGLAGREVLPRVGYAAQARTWGCGASAAL